MAAKTFTTIAVPDELVEKIDEVVKEKRYGYRSRPEFIKEAIRNQLLRVRKE